MKENNITEDDLIEIFRNKIKKESSDHIKKVILERNGEVNIVD